MPSTYERSFVKGVAWELISFLMTTFFVYIFYGDILESLKFSLILTLIKIPFYFVHERIWKMIKWGKIKHEPKENLFSIFPFHSSTHRFN